MAIYAISDLHLGSLVNKPMDRFGPEWVDHAANVARRWRVRVRDADTVLVCGDTSWAMRLAEALPDLQFIDALPGRKILLRGNHDYWWNSRRKLQAALPPSIRPLQHDGYAVEGWWVCGSRGWLLPGPASQDADLQIYRRELGRLRLSLESAPAGSRRLAMLHYPPYAVESGASEVLDLLREFEVEICVYGHLHAMAPGTYPEGPHRGIRFHCVSVDLVGFAPRRIVPLDDAHPDPGSSLPPLGGRV
jgi:predicted phosphohydrolase